MLIYWPLYVLISTQAWCFSCPSLSCPAKSGPASLSVIVLSYNVRPCLFVRHCPVLQCLVLHFQRPHLMSSLLNEQGSSLSYILSTSCLHVCADSGRPVIKAAALILINRAHIWCHGRPEFSNSLSQFLFLCWFDSPANIVFHCSPYSFY